MTKFSDTFGPIVIGAPVHERGWVLRHWLHHLLNQDIAPQDMHLIVNYGASQDDTLDILLDAGERYPWASFQVLHDTGGGHQAHRDWNLDRYATMVRLRNDLLKRVREIGAPYYLSCDTDILLPPGAIRHLARALTQVHDGLMARFGGIAPLTYMTPTGTQFTNCMSLGGAIRPRLQPDGVQRVDACFGVVLMNPALQGVDYATHPSGEDLGWAGNVARQGIPLGVDSRIRAKHVMGPEMLHAVDERVGF